MTNSKTGEIEEIPLGPEETIADEHVDQLNMILYLKDKHNILVHVHLNNVSIVFTANNHTCTGNAYHELAQLFKDMPRHYKLKQKVAELNSQCNTFPTPEGSIYWRPVKA